MLSDNRKRQTSNLIWDYLKSKNAEINYIFLPSKEELISIISEYDLLVMRADPVIDKSVLDAAVQLKSHCCFCGRLESYRSGLRQGKGNCRF